MYGIGTIRRMNRVISNRVSRNEDVAEGLRGGYEAKSKNFSTDGVRVYSYSTLIGFKKYGVVVMTSNNYSNTTTHHKGLIKQYNNYVEIDNFGENMSDLDIYTEMKGQLCVLELKLNRTRKEHTKESYSNGILKLQNIIKKFEFNAVVQRIDISNKIEVSI